MIKLYNTLTHKKEDFKPINGQEARMYSCGPTVYDFAHIGNLRAYVFADILKRSLLYGGYKVKHIMNITDVGHLTGDRDMGEDKIEKAATKSRKSAWEIAAFYTNAFLKDLEALNILPANKLPKATEHIPEMIKLIKILERKGYTYRTSDGIYFDTAKLRDYGKLAKLDIEGLKEGARVEANPEKKNLTDFALWKFSPPSPAKRDMEWPSPWGTGFPGWHIECSAMSTKYLGQPFDIHTGGIDFIPVHHTNEIAQSEAAFGTTQANFWIHSEFVMVNEEKMSKSLGNLITLDELQSKGYSPLAYRYFVLGAHYQSKLNFTWQALLGAQNALNNVYSTIAEYEPPKVGCAEYEKKFLKAVEDNLDTPKALAVVWELLKSSYPGSAKLQSLFEFDKILGLSLKETWKKLQKPTPSAIKKLLAKREKLRKSGNWAGADKIRRQIESSGFEIKDTSEGPKIKKLAVLPQAGKDSNPRGQSRKSPRK